MRHLGPIVFAAILAACLFRSVAAGTASEYEVKAAYIYNFTKFVEWPADHKTADSTVTVGVLGEDPFGDILDRTLEDKEVRGRRFHVRRSLDEDNLGDADVLFICESTQSRLDDILAKYDGRPVLLVSDIEGFARKGGTIELFRMGSKVQFEINVDTAARSALVLSSRLLDIARVAHVDSSSVREDR